ncbi:hypothetical protein COCON_G00099340 [Conger conger]|uniref:C2H2-type domain-containing protein n=1 Tax=Conger conger TaxID=82655 RepID=A0A9Q1DMX0_CONCO|nr:hypothetical protein COCON_G00099340 [Conger conger]
MTDTNSQSDSITDCIKCLSPISSAEDIKVESVTDSSDYTGVDPVSQTMYLLCREQMDILANMKVDEEDGERQSVEMERNHVVKDEEGLWKGEEKERDGHGEGRVTDQVAQPQNSVKNGVKPEHGKQEGWELSNLVTSCLLKQPRVLIHRLEIANISVSGSSPLRSMACKRDRRAASPWRQHELSPLRGNGSLRQKGQVVTWKRKTIGQLERPLKLLPSSSENGICAETSLITPVISPKNHQNTEQAAEMSSQVFACTQCQFVHTEEVNLHQHIGKVHPEELSKTVGIAEGEFGATLPSIEECKLSSVSCPPSQRVVDSAKLTDTNSQSEFITDCIKPLSPTSSGEDIEAEYLMDCTDYTGLNIRANFEETTEWKTGYSLSRVQKDMLTNLKEEEEEDGERQSVKIEMAVVKDEEGLWKEEVNEREKHGEGRVTNEAAQTHKLVKNGVKSEHGQQEGEELANLVTTCLLKQPRVLIHRLEIGRNSVPVSSPACPLACKRDQAVRSTWRQHEFFPLRGNGSAVRKGQVVTQKRKLIGQFRPLKLLPSSPRKGICADASPISPVITPRNQNTEQAAEMSSQVFACSQCPFVHAEEVNLHQHIEKVHPEELSRTTLMATETIRYADMKIRATCPFMDKCKLFSMSHQRVDSTKLTNTNSQSDSMPNSITFVSPAYSGEDIKAESMVVSSDYTWVGPGSSLKQSEDVEEKKTGYLMSRDQTDILINMKEEEEEEDWERQSVKMEREDGVGDEEGPRREEYKEDDGQKEGYVPNQVIEIYKWEVNEVKSEQQEGEEQPTLVTSCLLKQPRVLIHSLEMADHLVPGSSPPSPVACKSGQGVTLHESSPQTESESLRQKGQAITRKRNGHLERPLELLPSSSENRICAEASLISPVISSRNKNTGQTVEVSSQVFACSQCPYVHTDEVNLQQHIEKTTVEEGGEEAVAGDGGSPRGNVHRCPW